VQVFRLDENADCKDMLLKLGVFERATDNATHHAHAHAQQSGLAPPEVLEQGEAAWTLASDVWCFGVLVWKLFSGERSSLAASPSSDYFLSEGLFDGTIPAIAKPELCPNALWELAQRCTATQPTDRPSMSEVRSELDRLLLQVSEKPAAEEEELVEEMLADVATGWFDS